METLEQLISQFETQRNAEKESCSKIEQNPAKLEERESVSLGVASAPPPLFNAKEPLVELKHEKYEHRNVCFLKAQGFSNVEIAELTGYTPTAIGYIVKQPWAEKLILDVIHKEGGDAVHKLLGEEALKAAERLIQISSDAKINVETRRKANNDILDRVYGRPNQPYTEEKVTNVESLSDEELAKLVSKDMANRVESLTRKN